MKKLETRKLQIAVTLILLPFGLSGCFRVSSDVRALRDSVMKAAPVAHWEEQIEIGVGPITLNLARTGLAFVELEPEARTALKAVRGAEVGVYKRRGGGEERQLKPGAILRAADKAMTDRGWDRIVGVLNGRELVAIYAPREIRSPRNVKVCLVTVNERELVVASARSNLEPLMELACNHADWHRKARPPL